LVLKIKQKQKIIFLRDCVSLCWHRLATAQTTEETEVKKTEVNRKKEIPLKWYENINLRGYMQVAYNKRNNLIWLETMISLGREKIIFSFEEGWFF
jgi:hypothetical protein